MNNINTRTSSGGYSEQSVLASWVTSNETSFRQPYIDTLPQRVSICFISPSDRTKARLCSSIHGYFVISPESNQVIVYLLKTRHICFPNPSFQFRIGICFSNNLLDGTFKATPFIQFKNPYKLTPQGLTNF